MRWPSLVLSVFLLSSLPAWAARPRAWIGADRAELIAVLGPPQEVRSDGQGGSILVYSALRTLDEALEAPDSVSAGDDELHLGARLYFVDAAGRIYGKLDALNL